MNHEEQHQELLLTDILHAFFTNPLRPAYAEKRTIVESQEKTPRPLSFLRFEGGLQETGHAGEGFCFDNELPRHRVWLEPYALADRLVTCDEYRGVHGRRRLPPSRTLAVSDGWNAVQQQRLARAALLEQRKRRLESIHPAWGAVVGGRWRSAPVSHVSYYEADAYARWAGRRLATELEWEAAAEGHLVSGNLLDSGRLMPATTPETARQAGLVPEAGGNRLPGLPSPTPPFACPAQLFGDCWEWTASAYLGYPGFRPLPGSLGEYNGKFMNGQFVLRGGSCVTPSAHIRVFLPELLLP